ncbi:MAG TPA: glycosyltransferase family 39 protein [Candidatus Acidoferrum sp.]|nr:glycosyltransferase family 39 protein [Candidatus Acidoferrum sp.]
MGWTVLIVVTLCVCYFSHLGALGFVGPDEPRYAWIARAMAESGDWVTPRLYGQPWFEKPVLYYWSAALSFKLFGVSEAAARLPSAVSALLATLAMAWLALRVYGAATARWLMLLLPTCVGMIGFSHAAATDMPFSGMLTVAMVCAAVTLGLTRTEHSPILPRTPWLPPLLFGFFLGLAVLAKGPAAILLSGGAIFFWAILTKRWRDAFRLLHPAAIAAFCATALPWYILCARRNPDFFRVFVIEHNFKRYLTPEFQHIQPFWFYVPVLLVALLPWTATLLWSAAVGISHLWRTRTAGSPTCFLFCWVAFCVLFFSTSHSKLPGYILPAIPAIALLMARPFVAKREEHRISFRIAHLAIATSFLVIFAFMELLSHRNLGSAKAAGSLAMLMLLFALANAIAGISPMLPRFQHRELAAAMAAVPILIVILFANVFVVSYFRWDPSGRTIAREIERQHIPPSSLAVTNLSRGQQYSLSFYLHQEIKAWDATSETGGYLLTGSQNCQGKVGPKFFCEPQPFDLTSTGEFLYLVLPIAAGK